MDGIPPIKMKWDAEDCCLRPLREYRHMARRQFVHGEEYPMLVHEEHSGKSLRHYHALLKRLWENLPDEKRYRLDEKTGEIEDKYPTPEHLRKWALINLGYRKERHIPLESEEQAKLLLKYIQPIDDTAVVLIRGKSIVIYTAQSQSAYGSNRMTKEEFQKSKTEVLQLLSDQIGVSLTELRKIGDAA